MVRVVLPFRLVVWELLVVGYRVDWEEEVTGTTCVHTLTEASLNSEVGDGTIHPPTYIIPPSPSLPLSCSSTVLVWTGIVLARCWVQRILSLLSATCTHLFAD